MNILKAEISNRQQKRQQIWEQIIALDGQIAGLREAQDRIEAMPGYNAVLCK